jgi:hypothetical protein
MDSPSHSCSYQDKGRANAILSPAWDWSELSCVLSAGEILFRLFSPYHYTPGIVPLIVCPTHTSYPCINSNSDHYFALEAQRRWLVIIVFLFSIILFATDEVCPTDTSLLPTLIEVIECIPKSSTA